MGPRFFKRGNLLSWLHQAETIGSLQWGRAFSSAEITQLFSKNGMNLFCFNGAALFQARKYKN